MENNTKAKSWFVIVIGERERHGPYEITRKALICLCLCLMTIFAVTVVGSSWFWSRSQIATGNELKEELAAARQAIDLISREREDLLGENGQLKKQIARSLTKKDDHVKASKNEDHVTVVVDKEEEEEEAPVSMKNDAVVLSPGPFVSVEDIQITHNAESKKLKIRFVIRKESDDENYISGYVFIILNPGPGSSDLRKIYPTVELTEGYPQSYDKGENFSIARFKYIEGAFHSIADRGTYASFSVLVYEDNGTLRLKKEVPL